MNPRLSHRAIAATLAALGATAIVACGATNPEPANTVTAEEVRAPAAPAATQAADAKSDAPKTAEGAAPAAMPKMKHKKGASANCGAGTCG